ncbi:MAG: class I SAM-dependent methyltransferase [Candidatus Peribacteraceae bacterium]|nr:class I SAM-dependent methyltransferase [Candidatus Peribacteraceae bacterium]
MSIKEYYGKKGEYISTHKKYFSRKQLLIDINFIEKYLKLKKKDKILDLCCGNGRHAIELAKRGYIVHGLDFSTYLLKIAKEESKKENVKIDFFKQDIHKMNLKNKYNKIFLFFSEFGLFDTEKVLKNIYKSLENDGLFMLDYDNIFRLIRKMQDIKDFEYTFDFVNQQLVEKKGKQKVNYYTPKELKQMFNMAGFKVVSFLGDYNGDRITEKSKRIIIIGRKTGCDTKEVGT